MNLFKVLLPSVFTLDLFENGNVGNRRKEQNTGTEFDDVCPEDVVGRMFIVQHGFTYLHKSLPQYRMLNVSLCFLASVDAIVFRQF